MNYNPIFCALDFDNLEQAKVIASQVKDYVGGFKIGLELYTACGLAAVEEIAKFDKKIALDLKLYDIPNTVAKATEAAANLGVDILTIHASGGAKMIEGASNAANSSKLKIFAVTVLTSFSQEDLNSIGVDKNVEKQVIDLAHIAASAGAHGIVCSPLEIKKIKEIFKEKLELFVPGIRPANSKLNDQHRIKTPRAALNDGAEFLVIGRPITESDNPYEAAKAIYESIK